jgi:hypothetical protein
LDQKNKYIIPYEVYKIEVKVWNKKEHIRGKNERLLKLYDLAILDIPALYYHLKDNF